MDVSHIQRVFGYFKKSLVSIPINTNAFEEKYNNTEEIEESESQFNKLDDMLMECKNYKTNSTFKKTMKSTTPNKEVYQQKLSHNQSYVDALYYTLSCIKDPLLTLKGFDKSIATKMTHELLAYLDNTQVKVLDMVKYKYTKKGLRNILSVDYKTTDMIDLNIVRAISVVAVRYLKKPITIQIQGETKEHIPLPSSMIGNQEESTSTNQSFIINYVDNKFELV